MTDYEAWLSDAVDPFTCYVLPAVNSYREIFVTSTVGQRHLRPPLFPSVERRAD